jgi:hypothetical protein
MLSGAFDELCRDAIEMSLILCHLQLEKLDPFITQFQRVFLRNDCSGTYDLLDIEKLIHVHSLVVLGLLLDFIDAFD